MVTRRTGKVDCRERQLARPGRGVARPKARSPGEPARHPHAPPARPARAVGGRHEFLDGPACTAAAGRDTTPPVPRRGPGCRPSRRLRRTRGKGPRPRAQGPAAKGTGCREGSVAMALNRCMTLAAFATSAHLTRWRARLPELGRRLDAHCVALALELLAESGAPHAAQGGVSLSTMRASVPLGANSANQIELSKPWVPGTPLAAMAAPSLTRHRLGGGHAQQPHLAGLVLGQHGLHLVHDAAGLACAPRGRWLSGRPCRARASSARPRRAIELGEGHVRARRRCRWTRSCTCRGWPSPGRRTP
jgi:hypothetical protein